MRPVSGRLTLGLLAAAAVVGVLAPASSAGPRTGVPVIQAFAAPDGLRGATNAGEPSIGVNWRTGAVLFRATNDTYRVRFNAQHRPTWTLSQHNSANLDAILYTDSPTGRTWTGGLLLPCSLTYLSDDDTSWTPAANSCAGYDHETIGAGPWAGSPPVGAHGNRAVYYCAQAIEAMCAVSLDGGSTFGPEVPVGDRCQGGHGHVKVSADGSAYLPNARCGPLGTLPASGTNPGGGVSRDNGLTWSSYTVGEQVASTGFGYDPSVATTPDNTVYEAWVGPSGQPMVGRSGDHGATWSSTDLSRRGAPVNAVFPAMVAGRDGRVAVAYLGSRTPGIARQGKWHGVWHLYVSYSFDGARTWTTVQATTDPVQRGYICTSGTACDGHRNLLDFMDAQVTKDGRVVVGFADGCVGSCAGEDGTEKQSTAALASIAVQWGGRRLR